MIFEPNFINKSKKVTALISQPENGCVSKKVSLNDISDILGDDWKVIKFEGVLAFYEKGATNIPLDETHSQPTQLFISLLRVTPVFGTVIFCSYKTHKRHKKHKKDKKDKLELTSLKNKQISALSKSYNYKIEFKPEKNRSKDYSRLICNNEERIINLIIENNYIINRFGFISYRIDELIRKTKKKEKEKNKNKTLI